MIDTKKEISKEFNKKSILPVLLDNKRTFKYLISLIHRRNEKYKKEFLEIKNTHSIQTKEDLENFISFIYPHLAGLYLTNDPAVIKHFKQFHFKNELLKWFISIDSLTNEINKLDNNSDIQIDPRVVLIFCILYIEIKIMNSLQVEFDYSDTHNGMPEKSKSFITINNVLRKRDYHLKKGTVSLRNKNEKVMNRAFDIVHEEIKDAKTEKMIFKEVSQGEFPQFNEIISKCITSSTLSDRQLHIEMFPLIKLIFKDNKFLSRTEYFSDKIIHDYQDKKSDKTYDSYMASRVKKILLRK